MTSLQATVLEVRYTHVDGEMRTVRPRDEAALWSKLQARVSRALQSGGVVTAVPGDRAG
jgi:hypothetical protein